MTSLTANIAEIFSSLQGEGPHVGEPMTFVRFGGCSIRCRFCDTPEALGHSDICRIETPPGSEKFSEMPNPVSVTTLLDTLASFSDDTISVTGGEPLEQAGFLAEWLPALASGRRILLETNGILYEELRRVLPFVHIVGMDMKLPSSSGVRPLWEEHYAFLKVVLVSGRELYVKVVVTAGTCDRDIQAAIDLIVRTNKHIPLVIQPASPTLKFHDSVCENRLRSIERLLRAYLPQVHTIPQVHKELGVL